MTEQPTTPQCLGCRWLDWAEVAGSITRSNRGRVTVRSWICTAYPSGIPDRIVHDGESHWEVQPDQQGTDTFTLAEDGAGFAAFRTWREQSGDGSRP